MEQKKGRAVIDFPVVILLSTVSPLSSFCASPSHALSFSAHLPALPPSRSMPPPPPPSFFLRPSPFAFS